jgi:hypothetical protein
MAEQYLSTDSPIALDTAISRMEEAPPPAKKFSCLVNAEVFAAVAE